MGKPSVDIMLDKIRLFPGQTFTVFLQPKYKDVQSFRVELRVKPDGTPEIFYDEGVTVETFENWYDDKKRAEVTNGGK